MNLRPSARARLSNCSRFGSDSRTWGPLGDRAVQLAAVHQLVDVRPVDGLVLEQGLGHRLQAVHVLGDDLLGARDEVGRPIDRDARIETPFAQLADRGFELLDRFGNQLVSNIDYSMTLFVEMDK